MCGNVWEWCLTDNVDISMQVDEDYFSKIASQVSRGGSWRSNKSQASATYRFAFSPSFHGNHIGFRVVGVGIPHLSNR